MNAGQQAQGFNWYRTAQFGFYHVNIRFVHVRSVFKIGKSPLCLTDSEPNTTNSREIKGFPCDTAAAIADGRELWAMLADPGIVKFDNGSLRISWNEQGHVSLEHEGFGNKNALLFRDGQQIEA